MTFGDVCMAGDCEARKMTVRDTQYRSVWWITLIPWSLRWMFVFCEALLALRTNSRLHSWLPLTSLCQHPLCQLQVHLPLKGTKPGAENTCLTAQFGMCNCAAQHTGHAPQICFLSNLLLCQKVFTWKSVVHENMQISLLQGIYRLCLAQGNSPENLTSGTATATPLSCFLLRLVQWKDKQFLSFQ